MSWVFVLYTVGTPRELMRVQIQDYSLYLDQTYKQKKIVELTSGDSDVLLNK